MTCPICTVPIRVHAEEGHGRAVHDLRPSCGPFGTRCDMQHSEPLPPICTECRQLPTWCICYPPKEEH